MQCITKARQREGFRSLKTHVKEETISRIYDIDMVSIRGLPICDITCVCTGVVDMCGPVPYHDILRVNTVQEICVTFVGEGGAERNSGAE